MSRDDWSPSPRVRQLLDRGDLPECRYCGISLCVSPDDWIFGREHRLGDHCGCGEGEQCMVTGNWTCIPPCRFVGPWWHLRPGFAYPEVEHVLARVNGGTDDLDNLVLSCGPCNSSKGTRLVDEWMASL